MALVVIGGHSRNVGKTSVTAGIIAALPEFNWTALKITQFGHGICSADGKPCDCDTGDDHFRAISEERDRSGETDTSRFLVAGAVRSLWVRTRQGRLSEAITDIQRKVAGAENVIMESNSIVRFLNPDLYISVLDAGTKDFKVSAMEFLDRANAVIVHKNDAHSGLGDGVYGAGGKQADVLHPATTVRYAGDREVRARAPLVLSLRSKPPTGRFSWLPRSGSWGSGLDARGRREPLLPISCRCAPNRFKIVYPGFCDVPWAAGSTRVDGASPCYSISSRCAPNRFKSISPG